MPSFDMNKRALGDQKEQNQYDYKTKTLFIGHIVNCSNKKMLLF